MQISVSTPVSTTCVTPRSRSTMSNSVPKKAEKRRFLTITSRGSGATSGMISAPHVPGTPCDGQASNSWSSGRCESHRYSTGEPAPWAASIARLIAGTSASAPGTISAPPGRTKSFSISAMSSAVSLPNSSPSMAPSLL